MTRDSSRLRVATVGLVCVSLFAALFARLWFLQVMNAGSYDRAANVAAYRELVVPAPRGRILDRNGTVLADNKSYIVVTVDTQQLADVKSPDSVLSRLASLLNQYVPDAHYDTDTLRQKLRNKQVSPYKPVPVAADVPQDLEIYLAEHADKFPAVSASRETLRAYPYGTLAAQVLGYVGPIPEDQWKAHEGDEVPYQKDDDVGRAGVEKTFEKYLRGTPGKKVFEVDRVGNIVRTVSETPPTPGDDVYLTIDARAQAVAERGLADGLKKARNAKCDKIGCIQAPGGAMVVIDPRNGQVVAMASNPTYDPSWFVPNISSARWNSLNAESNNRPFTNRAVAEQYQPGSTFKLVTALAGLRTNVITPQTSYYDSGTYVFPNCQGTKEACTKKGDQSTPNGVVNLARALTVSSDTYFYKVGDLIWRSDRKNEIENVAHEFGFGEKTGVELADEQPGSVLTPQLLKKLHDDPKTAKAFPYADWSSGRNANLAIGQDVIAATPIQLANAYATFANGGTRYQPTLLLKVTKFRSGHVVMTQQPKVAGKVDIPATWRDAMLEGFAGVTTSGTASRAFGEAGYPMANLPVAGKTGTAQNIDPATGKERRDNALFAGFGPTDSPQYAAAAVFEQAGYGADVAAPAVVDFFLPLAEHGTFPELQPPSGAGSAPTAGDAADGSGAAITGDADTTGSGNSTTDSTIAPLESTDTNSTSSGESGTTTAGGD